MVVLLANDKWWMNMCLGILMPHQNIWFAYVTCNFLSLFCRICVWFKHEKFLDTFILMLPNLIFFCPVLPTIKVMCMYACLNSILERWNVAQPIRPTAVIISNAQHHIVSHYFVIVRIVTTKNVDFSWRFWNMLRRFHLCRYV